jgi:hypothetical protein
MTIQNTNTNKSELEHNNRQNSKNHANKTELIQELMKEEKYFKSRCLQVLLLVGILDI